MQDYQSKIPDYRNVISGSNTLIREKESKRGTKPPIKDLDNFINWNQKNKALDVEIRTLKSTKSRSELLLLNAQNMQRSLKCDIKICEDYLIKIQACLNGL